MIVIVPIHNQASNLPFVLEGYLRQTLKPSALVLILDRCTDASREVAERRRTDFEAAGIALHVNDTQEFGYLAGFGAGRTRDCGLVLAQQLGDGPYLFTDGDCIPSPGLVAHHADVLAVPHARISCGRRYDMLGPGETATLPLVLPDAQDDLRNQAAYMNGWVCTDNIDRLIFNHVVFESSWICWSCNLGMNKAAVDLCRGVNAVLDGSHARVFSPVFDGRWGGEDGFVGLSVYRCGGETVMLSQRSYVKHIWHKRGHTNLDHLRLVQRQDYELHKAIFEGRLHADVTKVNIDFSINRGHVDPWVLTQIKDIQPSAVAARVIACLGTDATMPELLAALYVSGYLAMVPAPGDLMLPMPLPGEATEVYKDDVFDITKKLQDVPFVVQGVAIYPAMPTDFNPAPYAAAAARKAAKP